MPQEPAAPRGLVLGRMIMEQLRAAFRFVWSERFARVLIAAVDLALAMYQMAVATV